MAIIASDILFKYSTKSGSAGNSQAGTAAGSLGKYISTTQISSGVLNNLFDDVSGAEDAASDVEYRCFFVHNNHGSLTWQNVVVWLQSEVANGANIEIAIDDEPDSPIGQVAAQAEEIADEDTAPTAVGAFSAPATEGAALSLGDIAPGNCRAVWVKRSAQNNGPLNNDGVTLRIKGDTAA